MSKLKIHFGPVQNNIISCSQKLSCHLLIRLLAFPVLGFGDLERDFGDLGRYFGDKKVKKAFCFKNCTELPMFE
jgi:hypothetical protein